jgi:chromate transporter
VLFAKVSRPAWGPLSPHIPDATTLDPIALALSIIAALALLRFHLGIGGTLALAAALGLVVQALR